MSEQRTFKMHPALLFSVIKSQAGSLAKGVIESVMNSIDAGATKVEIVLTESEYTVTDDGKGFVSRKEIEEFFETFGTPHKEGDATYGKFRIGRGQGFAFAINTWRTGQFEMHVDIKNKGLDYILKDNLEVNPGCVIKGVLYTKLAPTDLLTTQRTLTDQCLYTPIPVYLNGKLISKDATKEKWDFETEDAYIKLMAKNSMAVYNLGILVNHFRAFEFGTGGIVVSKKQLDLNFARNDVMRQDCKVWKSIKPYLKGLSEKVRKTKKITEEWRQMKALELVSALSGELDMSAVFECLNAPLFTDISGKHYSASQLSSKGTGITISKRGDFSADRVSQHKLAIVLDEEIVYSRFNFTFPDLLEYIKNNLSSSNNVLRNSGYKYTFENIQKQFKNLEFYTAGFNTQHDILETSSLNDKEKLALNAIDSISRNVMRRVNEVLGIEYTDSEKWTPRQILSMKSETALAFTDGTKFIWIHKKYLSGDKGPARGFDWAFEVVSIILHEYCHNFNSGVGHTHDSDFYQLFHDSTVRTNQISLAVNELLKMYMDLAISHHGKLSKKLGEHANRVFKMEENLAVL